MDHHVHHHIHLQAAGREGRNAHGLQEAGFEAALAQGGDSRVEALQVTHLSDESWPGCAGFGQGPQEGHALVQGGRKGFLHQHVFSGFQGLEAEGVVEPRGRRDLHGIHLRQHLVQGGRPGSVELGGDLGAPHGIGVHHGAEDGPGRRGHDPGVMLSQMPHAHDRHKELCHVCLPINRA